MANLAAAFGFRIKSGWTAAVLVGGSPDAPRLLDRREIELSDPNAPELRQPYHAAMSVGLSHGPTLTRRLQAIEHYSRQSLSLVVTHYEETGYSLCGAGLVVGSDVDPERIGNQHIRAHALEGRLFRRMVEEAMDRGGLPCSTWVERTLYAAAAPRLQRSEAQVKKAVTELGRGVCGGWRSDDKTAAVAAWLVLAEKAGT